MLKRNWSLTGVSLAAIIFYAVCGLLMLLLPSASSVSCWRWEWCW